MSSATAAPTTVLRWSGVRAPLATAAGLGLAALALRIRDPHRHASWGLCPFKAITGWDCPGCGGLRATNDLTHGQIAEAWHSNALFLALIPVAAALWGWWLVRGWTGSTGRLPAAVTRVAAIGLGVVALAFTIYRNTPAGSAYFVN